MLSFFCGDTGEDAAAAAEAAKAKNFADELKKKMAWDFCIVTPKCSKDYMKELDKRVRKAGFKTDMFESAALKDDEAVLFLRLSVPKARLMEYAAAIGAPARLDPKALRKACSKLNPPINFDKKAAGGQSLSDVSLGQKLMPPFLHIYGPVRHEKIKVGLYLPFIDHNRHKLCLRMLTGSNTMPDVNGKPNPMRGAGLAVRAMDTCEPFTSYKIDEETGTGPRDATIFVIHAPIEDKKSLRYKIYTDWIRRSNMPWKVPVQRLRSYLGDQTGFYFMFLSTYSKHCLPLGILGVMMFCWTSYYEPGIGMRRQLPSCAFAPFVVIAMAIFMADFRRKQCEYAKEWGCFAWASGKPRTRPAFKGTPQTCPINGNIIIDWPPPLRAKRVKKSWTIIAVLIVIVMFAVGFIFWLKWWAVAAHECGEWNPFDASSWSLNNFWYTFGSALGGALNGLQVAVLNKVYEGQALGLTMAENWRTDGDYSNNLIAKLALFKFVNTFSSVFFTAFFKKVMGGCIEQPGFCQGEGRAVLNGTFVADEETQSPSWAPTMDPFTQTNDCLGELSDQVMGLFLTAVASSFVTGLVLPLLKKRKIQAKTGGGYGDDDPLRSACRRQFVEMSEYDNIEESIKDYMEMAIQFGFLVMFGASFATAPMMCFIFTVVQLKQDAFKMLWLTRRPTPMEVKNIGVWEKIFDAILHTAALTNVGMIVFTTDIMDGHNGGDGWTPTEKLGSFIVGSCALLFAIKVIESAHPAESVAISTQLQRQAVYVERVVKDVEVDLVIDEAEAEHDKGGAKHLVEANHVDYNKVHG